MSIQQQNVAPYIKSEYGTPKPSAVALIRAQGEQIRRMSAEEYLKDKSREAIERNGRSSVENIDRSRKKKSILGVIDR